MQMKVVAFVAPTIRHQYIFNTIFKDIPVFGVIRNAVKRKNFDMSLCTEEEQRAHEKHFKDRDLAENYFKGRACPRR